MDPALRSRLDLAAEYLRKGNHRGARDHLQKALEIDSRSAEAYDLLALMYYKELELNLAEENYKKAISYDRYFTRGFNNYGSFLYAQGRYDEACKTLTKASEDVNYVLRADVFNKLGLCKLKTDDIEAAVFAFKKAAALSPRWPDPYLELADLEFQQKNIVNAKQYLNYFDRLTRKPTARSLWLGIRLEHQFGNLDARDSQGLALSKLFPDSAENLAYKQWRTNGYKQPKTE